MRDHGGNIDAAIARFGGNDWIDLSTGINREPYPVPDLPLSDWTMLPTHAAKAAAVAAARVAYKTDAPMLATAGAQAAIQMIPRLTAPGIARILGPTYNEYGAALRNAGWQVEQVTDFDALAGADLAGASNLIVLRSFGKFYGLAGLRLGFAIGCENDIARLTEMSGPWPVNGAALRIATQAFNDSAWAEATILRLRAEAIKADELAKTAGWAALGGTELFRLYETPDAQAAQETLARHQIWSRIFPYSNRWLRLGLPGGDVEWARFARALEG